MYTKARARMSGEGGVPGAGLCCAGINDDLLFAATLMHEVQH
jgi:hypothetical protein